MAGVGEMIATAVVKEIVGRLTQSAIDEIAVQWGYKDEVVKMAEKMKNFAAVMHDADNRLRQGGPDGVGPGRWLMKLKSVAYDIEDVLDDLDDPKSQPKFQKSIRRIRKPHKMVKVRKKIEELVQDRDLLNLQVPREAWQGGITNSETIRANNGMVGRIEEMGNIINLLIGSEDQEDISIIPIIGLGGIGKTTLAQSVFTDEKVVNFFNFRVWVNVTKNLELSKIGNIIMETLKGDPRLPNSSLDLLYENLKNLATTRYLIVLDDLWEEDYNILDNLKLMLQNGSKGSKIIVTTRNLSVVQKLSIASPAPGRRVSVVSPSDQIILNLLSPDERWDLMKIKALGHLGNQSDLEEIGMQIAHKCVGLPLVVNALGQVMFESRNVEKWKNIRDTKVELGLRAEHQDKTLECLMLSYYYMKQELKLCFNYLAAFPKGFVMNSDLLIKQWNALGYIDSEYDGDGCINYFIGMSFLQNSGSASVGTSPLNAEAPREIVMHDLVHELASIITAEEFLVLDATDQKKWNISIHCRHVQLIKYKNQFNVFKHLPRKLRSLHFRNSHELQLSKKSFSRFKYIRILDLSFHQRNISSIVSNVSLKTVPDNICNLYKLCYLDLSGNRSLNKLPASLGTLSKLSFLNLSGCSILQELPKSICQLTCLQHLDMSECRAIQNLPDKFGSLTNLLFLSLSGCSKLTKLPDSFGRLPKLLFLNLSDCSKLTKLPDNVSLEFLKHLNLSSCHELENLPQHFGKLKNLVSLNLSDCYKVSVLPETFCQLTHLKDLDLSDCHALKELPDRFGDPSKLESFNRFGDLSKLESLNLSSCSKLELLPESLSKMLNLRVLNVSYCTNLNELPSSLGNLKLHILDIRCALALTGLPDGIDTMTSLTQLEVMPGNTRVSEMVEGIKKNLKLPMRTVHNVQQTESRRCSNIVELAQLTCPELEVVRLQNVKDPEDAERAKLRDKSDLRLLSLKWGYAVEDIEAVGVEAFLSSIKQPDSYLLLEEHKFVLERLVPPRTLEQLLLEGYLSTDFPKWVSDIPSHLPFLTFLGISGLGECHTLPPFGELPNLRSLYLGRSRNIKKIGSEFYGDSGTCRKLRVISLSSMENLEEWWTTRSGAENKEFLIPNLHSLILVDCPKLKFLPYPPRSSQWMLDNSDEGLPEGGFGNLQCTVDPFEMVVRNCNFSPNKWNGLQHFITLEILTVQSCSSFRALPDVMQFLTSLTALHLISLHELQELPECLGRLTSLEKVSIINCPNLISLPETMKNLTALRKLCLKGCTGLKILPGWIAQLISLQTFEISVCFLTSLPEWLGQLSSLEELSIILCPYLTSLPESIRHLTALKKLHIEGCQILAERCQREDTHKISHIPEVTLPKITPEMLSEVHRMELIRPWIDPRASTSRNTGAWTSGDAGASTSRDAGAWASRDAGAATYGDAGASTSLGAGASASFAAFMARLELESTLGYPGTSTYGDAGASASGDAGALTYGDIAASTSRDTGESASLAAFWPRLLRELESTSGDAGASTSGDAGASTSGDTGASTYGDAGASASGDAGALTYGDIGALTSGDAGESASLAAFWARLLIELESTSGDAGASTYGDAGASTSGDAGASTSGDAGASTSGDAGASTSQDAGASTS